MPTDAWYYAEGNAEQGPISLSELKAILGAGTLSHDTLVWQEGMADWTAAKQVSALALNATAAPAAGPLEPPPPPVAPALPLGTAVPPSLATLANSPLGVLRGGRSSRGTSAALLWRLVGLPLFMVGLAMLLFSRGCDTLSQRYATRLQALSQVAEVQFRDEWDTARMEAEAKRDEAIKRSDSRQAEAFTERLKILNDEKSAEQERLRRGKWRTLAQSARDAEAGAKIWGFWRECWHLLGLCVLTLGLACLGLGSTGPERWFSLILLAVIVCTLLSPGVTLKLGG